MSRESSPPLPTVARAAFGQLAVVLLATGIVAVYQGKGDVSSAALIIGGLLTVYLSVTGDRITGISTSGVSFAERWIRETISGHSGVAAQDLLAATIAAADASNGPAASDSDHAPLPPTIRAKANEVVARKGELLRELCRAIDIDPLPLGVGSSLPSEAFRAAALRFGIPTDQSMPDIAKQLIELAENEWSASYASTGSTVTRDGLEALLDSVIKLNRERGLGGGPTVRHP